MCMCCVSQMGTSLDYGWEEIRKTKKPIPMYPMHFHLMKDVPAF